MAIFVPKTPTSIFVPSTTENKPQIKTVVGKARAFLTTVFLFFSKTKASTSCYNILTIKIIK